MKKLMFLMLLLTFVLGGCSQESYEKGNVFKDDLNREVKVKNYKRTAVLLGSFADVWMLAGGEICATASDAWEDFNLDLPEACVNLGKTKNLSLESLMASDPDLIIASANTKQHIEWKETLENAGIPVLYFDVSNFDDYLRMLNTLTDITGRKDLYEKNGVEIKSRIEEVIKKSKLRANKNPRVLYLRVSGSYIRAKNSEGSVLGEILKDLGCINIADSEASLLENLSFESIIKMDPDYIFAVQVADDMNVVKENVENMFKENPAWRSLSAVKNNRLFYLDKMLYNFKPNLRWGEAYEKLEEFLSQ